jgi:hypothetical protein
LLLPEFSPRLLALKTWGAIDAFPSLVPARKPPLWALPVAGQVERKSDAQASPAPDCEFELSLLRTLRNQAVLAIKQSS